MLPSTTLPMGAASYAYSLGSVHVQRPTRGDVGAESSWWHRYQSGAATLPFQQDI